MLSEIALLFIFLYQFLEPSKPLRPLQLASGPWPVSDLKAIDSNFRLWTSDLRTTPNL